MNWLEPHFEFNIFHIKKPVSKKEMGFLILSLDLFSIFCILSYIMVGQIIDVETGQVTVSKIRCPWRVVKENKNNFISVDNRNIDDKFNEVRLTTSKGYQLRFKTRLPYNLVDKVLLNLQKSN